MAGRVGTIPPASTCSSPSPELLPWSTARCLHCWLLTHPQDLLGNTPLHYATQFWDQDTVTKLLELGANIGLRNKAGEAPIAGILPATMEKFLDNSCLKVVFAFVLNPNICVF